MQASFHAPIHMLDSIWIDGKTVCLWDQITQTLSFANLPLCSTPAGLHFAALLHGILPIHGLTLRHIYIYLYPLDVSSVVMIAASTVTVSRARYVIRHLSDANAIIGINVFALLPVIIPDLTSHSWFDSQFPIWFRLYYSIWFGFPYSIDSCCTVINFD